jgi:DNA polymerase III subunit epsilon
MPDNDPLLARQTRSIDQDMRDLATRLKITRPLCFLDLETTGTTPEVDRILEIAWIAVHPDGRVKRYRTLVNPEQPIPEESSSVHGIRDEHVKDAPKFKEIAAEIAHFLLHWDIAGYNVRRFDLKLLAAEFARCGIRFSAEDATVVDAMFIYQRYEKRDLTAAVKRYCDREHHGHRAEEDVEATIEVFRRQLDTHADLPADVRQLDAFCRNRQPDWLTADGKIAWRDNAARITFGKYKGRSLQELARQDPGYLQWMADKDFSEQTKQMAEDALQGRFPFKGESKEPL